MTQLIVKLPDELAQRAREAGLLSDAAIQSLLEDAMRHQAGRRLLAIADELRAANIEPMSDEQVVAIVKEVRAEGRAQNRGKQ